MEIKLTKKTHQNKIMTIVTCQYCNAEKDSEIKGEIGVCPICCDVFCNESDCFIVHWQSEGALTPLSNQDISEMQDG